MQSCYISVKTKFALFRLKSICNDSKVQIIKIQNYVKYSTSVKVMCYKKLKEHNRQQIGKTLIAIFAPVHKKDTR